MFSSKPNLCFIGVLIRAYCFGGVVLTLLVENVSILYKANLRRKFTPVFLTQQMFYQYKLCFKRLQWGTIWSSVASSFLPSFLRVGKVKEIPNYFETAFPLMNNRHLLLNAANTDSLFQYSCSVLQATTKH